MLKCSDNSFYTGITTDLNRRLHEHNSAGARSARYTRARLPVSLVYQERADNRSLALKREAQIRKLSRLAKRRLAAPEAAEPESR